MAQHSIQTVLSGLRGYFDMDVAFVSEFVDDQRVFRFVDSAAGWSPIRVDGSDPIDEAYCGHVVSGVIPQVIQDATKHPVADALAATHALAVRAHLSVPIVRGDGAVYGTLCAFSRSPSFSLSDNAVHVLRAAAVVVGLLLESENAGRRATVAIEEAIDTMVASGGPRIEFQPIVDVATGRAVGHEALSRFPDGRSPDRWFAEAWAAGRGTALEVAAVGGALRAFPRLRSSGYVSVNLSATSCADGETLDMILAGPVDRLVVEITEHSAIDSVASLVESLAPFRAAGGRLAIDDVGMGFSGLSQLVDLSPEIIKLDRTLIAGIADDTKRRALVLAMAAYADEVGSTLVAEGVEDADTAAVLLSLGVRLAQGYHFGRPAPPPG